MYQNWLSHVAILVCTSLLYNSGRYQNINKNCLNVLDTFTLIGTFVVASWYIYLSGTVTAILVRIEVVVYKMTISNR